jgi:hypothetical protein
MVVTVPVTGLLNLLIIRLTPCILSEYKIQEYKKDKKPNVKNINWKNLGKGEVTPSF